MHGYTCSATEMIGQPIDKRALVEFENGMQILLSPGMKWENVPLGNGGLPALLSLGRRRRRHPGRHRRRRPMSKLLEVCLLEVGGEAKVRCGLNCARRPQLVRGTQAPGADGMSAITQTSPQSERTLGAITEHVNRSIRCTNWS